MKKILASALVCLSASFASANSVTISDTTFSIFNGQTQLTSGNLDVRWGSFSGGVFTPFLGNLWNSNNAGYVDFDGSELLASFSQGDNLVVSQGTQLALVVTNVPYGEENVYAPSSFEAVLTDPSWLAPTFALVGQPDLSVLFTANTTALKGAFDFNGGAEIINLASTVIPEPSSFAAIAGLAVVGMAASRRRRSA